MSARRRAARAMLGAACALTACALAACGREPRPDPDADDTSAAGDSATSPAGASATLRGSACGTVAPTGTVHAHRVSDGGRGMITAVRWTVAPDGCALLAVEDPISVEADPAVDRAVYARERDGVAAVVDSAWDVQPDRVWSRLAVGRAHVAVARDGSDTLPTSAWQALARATRRPLADVRASAFPASGMAVAYAVAQPRIVWLDSLRAESGDAAVAAPSRALPMLGGWRVRWSEDGETLAVGGGPERAGDDELPAAWLTVSAATGRPSGGVPLGAAFGAVPVPGWSEDLLLERGAGLDPTAARTLPVRGGTVEGRDGQIALVRADGGRTPVGPGTPLVTTTNGRVILALVPRTVTESYQLPVEVVLYVVR